MNDLNECEHCGSPIQQPDDKGRPKRFCSAKCQSRAYRSKQRQKREPHRLSCAGCGTDFTTEHKRKYCTADCRDKFFRDQSRVSRSKICLGCSKPFEARDGRQAYCSQDCRRLASNRRMREADAKRIRSPHKLTCPNCSREFETMRLRKFCKGECATQFHANKQKSTVD